MYNSWLRENRRWASCLEMFIFVALGYNKVKGLPVLRHVDLRVWWSEIKESNESDGQTGEVGGTVAQ